MRYIIVDSVKDGNRYLRSFNKKTNLVTYNVKCVHLIDFAKEVVVRQMAQMGVIKAVDILEVTSCGDLLCEILENKTGEDYFVPSESISTGTCEEILDVMNQLRMGVVTNAYDNTDDSTILQLKDLINTYEKCLSEMDVYDIPLLYKKAIAILNENKSTIPISDSYEISDACKSQLTALENNFLDLYTCNKYKIFSVIPSEQSINAGLAGAKFFRAYGISNEVRYVISQIIDKGQQLGDVEIFYSSADYEPYIEACFSADNIPYSMINRKLPADNIYINVMKHIVKWAEGNFTYEALRPVMILSKYRRMYFSQIKAGIGWGLERYKLFIDNQRAKEFPTDEQAQARHEKLLDFCDCLMELVQVFDVKGNMSYETVCEKLISATRRVLGNKADYKFASVAFKSLCNSARNINKTNDIKEILKFISKELKELSYGDSEISSAVCIRKMDKNVHILERKHIYVIGMSNAHYSSSSVESPVLSDDELEKLIDAEKGYVALIKHEEEEKKNALYATLSSRDINGTLTVGYCCYDTVNLREQSPSIPYIRMVQNAGISDGNIDYAGYENIITGDVTYIESDIWNENTATIENTAITEVRENTDTEVQENTEKEDAVTEDDDIIPSPISEWSTTSLQQLLDCPRKFYYQRVLFLPNEDYKIPKADTWLSASEKGTLAHGIMEDYCNEIFLGKAAKDIPPMLNDKLLQKIMNEHVEDMLKKSPYMSNTAFKIECDLIWKNCKIYLEKMHNEFSDIGNKWVVEACEKNFSDVNIKFQSEDDFVNLKFSGQMDRIDSYVDETGKKHYRIIDYKSGSRKRNEENIRMYHNVQHIVYKLALEAISNEDVEVEEVCFLHFFEDDLQNQHIILKEDSIKDFPMDVHCYVIRVLKAGTYKKCSISDGTSDDEDKACKYCTYKDICDERIGDQL